VSFFAGPILLKGGHVIDPANNLDGVADVRIDDGKIEAVAPNLPEKTGERVVDVTGFLVTPGIIDMHAHVAHSHTRSTLSLHPLVNTFSSGVTTTVDAGTTGWRDFDQFRHDVIDPARIRVLSYVNIVGSGMGGPWEHEAVEMNAKFCADTALMHSDVVVGIKTAHYWANEQFDDDHLPWTAVDRGIEAAELAGMPIMVDFFPNHPLRTYEDLITKKLRAGDIHTHVYAQQFPSTDKDGKLYDYFFRARDKGVIFDVGHGAGSFWYRNAVPAIEQGFIPDSISTDLHTGNVAGVVVDMITTMNKIMAIGVPLNDVIAKSTVAPAKEIGHPELGTLSVGASADVAVLELEQGSFGFVDCGRNRLDATERLRCEMTVYGGSVVYNPNGRGLPDWKSTRTERYPIMGVDR
jgi:dihydroorotase